MIFYFMKKNAYRVKTIYTDTHKDILSIYTDTHKYTSRQFFLVDGQMVLFIAINKRQLFTDRHNSIDNYLLDRHNSNSWAKYGEAS